MSKTVPDNIRDDPLEDDHPLNDKLSRGAVRHRKFIEESTPKTKLEKSKKIKKYFF